SRPRLSRCDFSPPPLAPTKTAARRLQSLSKPQQKRPRGDVGMNQEPLTLIGISDVSGRVRGKAVPTAHLAEHVKRGIGWTPTNVMITAFGPILDTPVAGLGDILMRPVPETEVKVDFGGDGGSEHFLLADIVN